MRIIAGKAKGLRLKAPKGYGTRPTAERVKESMFSMIQGFEEGARVLDLFAGTGALGLEALSRGAIWAVFVENHPAAWKALSANIEKSKMKPQAEVIKADVVGFLKYYSGEPFDLVFMDPPYGSESGIQVLRLLLERKLLNSQGLVIWERSIKEKDIHLISGLRPLKDKQYGDTLLLVFEHVKEEEGDGRI